MFDETPTDPYNNNFHEYAYLNRYNVFGDPRLDVISDKEVDQSADETVDEDYGEMDWSAEEHGSVEDDTSEDSENDTSPKQSQSSQSDLSDSCGSPANEKLSELVVQEEAALPPPVFEFTFTVEHNINLSIEVTPPEDTSITTPPTLSKLPENRKRKAIHSLMEMMTLSENISPKYNPTTMPSPEETAKRRRLGTFPIPTTNLPLSVYNPSARSTSKPPDPKRLKIYFHKACLHRVDYKTLPEILETYESTTNLIRTADANHFFIAEPRWCTDCIFMKSSSLRVNYPEPSSLTKRDLLIHAKEKGWRDGKIASLSTPISVCLAPYPAVDEHLYHPPSRAEERIEMLFGNVGVESAKVKRKRGREVERMVEMYNGGFMLGMKFGVSREEDRFDVGERLFTEMRLLGSW